MSGKRRGRGTVLATQAECSTPNRKKQRKLEPTDITITKMETNDDQWKNREIQILRIKTEILNCLFRRINDSWKNKKRYRNRSEFEQS